MKGTSKISITLSILGIITAIWAQYQLLDGYESASGKTRALYGMRHLAYMWYALFGCGALLFFILSIFSKEKLKALALTFILAVGSILLLVLPIWRSFV